MQHRSMRDLAPARKLALLGQLRHTAWQLKRAGLKMLHPHWTDEQIDAEVRRIFLYARS